MRVPGRIQIKAAWHALPAEARDRIGILVVNMVFQSFVGGDGYAPSDRAVPGRSKAACAIRGEAQDESCRMLTEVHDVIEDALPDLFGPAGQNPKWAAAMGAKR